MWLVLFRIGAARPWAAARQRLRVGPSSTNASRTKSPSTSRTSPSSCDFTCALATAERSVLLIVSAAPFFENCRMAYASLTVFPRIWSITSRALRGLMLSCRAIALASIARSPLPALGPLVGELAPVTPEQPGRGELTELVTNHVLRDVHGNELVSVVHRDGVSDELRRDRRRARPRLDDLLLVPRVHALDLEEKLVADERTLLYATRHCLVSGLLRGFAATAAPHDVLGRFLLLPARLLAFRLAPRRHGRTSTGRAALTTTQRVIDRVHRHTAHLG